MVATAKDAFAATSMIPTAASARTSASRSDGRVTSATTANSATTTAREIAIVQIGS